MSAERGCRECGPGCLGHAHNVLVVGPGDRVLVALNHNQLSREQADTMRRELTEQFPGVEFTFLAGVAALARFPVAPGPVDWDSPTWGGGRHEAAWAPDGRHDDITEEE